MRGENLETLLYHVDDGIATVTLHRPDKLNAFTVRMKRELLATFDATDADDEVKAVIVTGSGRGFCAGADLSDGETALDVADNEGDNADTIVRDGGGLVALRIFRSLKPVIAAVNGAAVGVGATMQLPMDIRIASTAAKFGFVFVRRGVVPEAASSWFLPRVVGLSTALEWCFSGRLVSADEAQARGLVRSLHAPEELLPAARSLARGFIDHSAPVSVALTRQMIWRMSCADHPMLAHRVDSRGIQVRGRSKDAHEGITAFLNKRPAVFPDRVSKNLPDIFADWKDKPFT